MIPPKEFALMVSEDIKGKSDSVTHDLLRSQEHREQWRESLIAIINNVNDQIKELTAEADHLRNIYNEDFVTDPAESISAKIDKAERFRYHAEKRLAEADRLISVGAVSKDMKLSSFLKDAIVEHMRLKKGNNSYDKTDRQLWEAINGKWSFREAND